MGHVTSYAFDPSLAVSTVTTADGYVLTRRNNEAGHILGASDDAGDVIQYHYSSRGELLCATTPDGAKTSFEYDHWGNRTAVIEPDGSRKTITYDVFGRPTSVVDAAGGTTRFEYDVRGGVVSITRPNGASERFTYDAGGRVRTYTDADGGVTSMRWGHQRRVMELTKANGDVTHYRYDYDGRLVSIQNSAQQQHHLHYDPSGWLTAERTFGGRTLRYTRDLSGTLTSFTQGDEQPVLLTRDATGVVTAREYPDGAVHQLSHDEMGRLTRAVTDDTECRRQYDSRGNLIEEYQTVAGDSCWVRYTYDAMGRRLSRSSSRGHQDVFYRDAAGRLERIALDDEDIRFRYSADGRIIDRQLSRGLCVRTHYDSELRLVGRDVVAPAPTTRVAPGEPARVDGGRARAMAWRRYQYSLEGKLTTVSDEAGTTSLTYDACGQLLQRHGHNAATSERYNYLPGGLVVEAHDDAPERDYDADGRVLRRGDERFTYDTCGRLTSRQSAGAGPQWRYQYDGAGMLVSATKPGECRVNHSYDALGRRLLSRIYDGGGRLIKTRRFIWDENILLHVITRRWNARGGYRETERSYVIGPASHAPWAHRDVDIDGDERRAGAWVHYVNDAVGAPHMLVNGDGSALRRVNMSSWGAVSGECDTALRLPGCYADEETGLLYNRWRYLD
ncbi:MAG TPA: RHS repeat protein, partial [Sorangium sp.]|nr:RHS repeat protein [Sorangium sp.]